jgi:o-succinylbenzoate---CoA ligase
VPTSRTAGEPPDVRSPALHVHVRYRGVPELVALAMPGGTELVAALEAVWEAGDAATVLDPRLPPAARGALERALAPGAVMVDRRSRLALEGGRPVEEGDALVVATSGSTGEPRGVVLGREAVEASARLTSKRLEVDPGRHAWLACLPLAHIGGLSVVTRALLTSTPVDVLDGFDPSVVEERGRRGVSTHVSLVATALRRLDASVFACVLLGGAAPPSEGLGPNVVTTYGMTETGSGVVYDGWPLDGVEVALSDHGTGGSGASGEILLRSPTMLRCYRDGSIPFVVGPDGTGGWLPTGDGGELDARGRLTVHGRLAEVIVSGGEKVWPGPVEQTLSTHPAVGEVAVWKRADDEWGERVVAWVVPADPAHPPVLEELRALVATKVAPWAAPKELQVVPRLPRTPSGKVRRRGLT